MRATSPIATLPPVPARLATALLILAVFVLALSAPARAFKPDIRKASVAEFDALMGQGKCLVVAMAAWCGPCRKELPHLVELYPELTGQGLAIYGLSLDFGGPEAIAPLAGQFNVPFPIYWVGEEAIDHYQMFPIPMILAVEQGEIIDRLVGASPLETIREFAQRLIDR